MLRKVQNSLQFDLSIAIKKGMDRWREGDRRAELGITAMILLDTLLRATLSHN